MNTNKMYHLDKCCYICMNKTDLKHLFEVDNDGISHYSKLTSSIAEMNFKEMNNQRLICGDCCVTLNTVYNFRQMCLRSKTKLITYISQLQTSDHINGTVRVCRKGIKSELIVAKNRGGSEKEGSNCLEGSNPQIKFQNESYKENIELSALVKEECKSEDNGSSANDDAIVDHMNESAHSDVKVENVEYQTMMEDYSEYYTEFKIEIEEVKQEPLTDTETSQDGSTSQPNTGTSAKPKGSEETTIGSELTQTTQKNNGEIHQCEICQKSFNYKCNLTAHIKKHSSERPYECEICKKCYKHKFNLTTHMKTHSSKRPYECEICKKGFKLKGYLTSHMEIHSSERPYKCEICNKDFKQKDILSKHMKIHFSEKSYKCEICKKGFNHKFNVTRHMKTHSIERTYE